MVSEALSTDYENETSLLFLGESPERIVFPIDLHLDSESGLTAGDQRVAYRGKADG